jgi:hypothetical protein
LIPTNIEGVMGTLEEIPVWLRVEGNSRNGLGNVAKGFDEKESDFCKADRVLIDDLQFV